MWTRKHCAVQVKVLLKRRWTVTVHFESTDNELGGRAANSGKPETLSDNKRGILRTLFFFYVPIYFLFLYLLVIQSRVCLHTQRTVSSTHFALESIQIKLISKLQMSQLSDIYYYNYYYDRVTVLWNVLFEVTEDKVSWSTAAAGTTTHVASDVVLCMYSRWCSLIVDCRWRLKETEHFQLYTVVALQSK